METNRESKRYFRKIPSLKFLYEISNDGRIFRNVKSKKQHRQFKAKSGYYVVNCKKDSKHVTVTVHSLVAECWLGSKPEGYIIDHIDRNKSNNHHSNLRYTTYTVNLHNTDRYGNVIKALDDYRPQANQRAREVLGHKLVWGDKEFESKKQAAEYIAKLNGMNVDTVRSYFTRRRKYVCGKTVKYL